MPPSYFPETMPQASGDQVMAPTPGDRAEQGDDTTAPSSPRGYGTWPQQYWAWGALSFGGLGRNPHCPTYLVEELRELHLHLFPLEHVVLGLLADWRNQVELPGHRVRFLQKSQDRQCPAAPPEPPAQPPRQVMSGCPEK